MIGRGLCLEALSPLPEECEECSCVFSSNSVGGNFSTRSGRNRTWSRPRRLGERDSGGASALSGCGFSTRRRLAAGASGQSSDRSGKIPGGPEPFEKRSISASASALCTNPALEADRAGTWARPHPLARLARGRRFGRVRRLSCDGLEYLSHGHFRRFGVGSSHICKPEEGRPPGS
jgi:hypothetical protein